jgi:hypothetical protein
LRAHIVIPLTALFCISVTASADDLTWGGTYVSVWNAYGTSPYTATDISMTPRQTLQLFCLDFNDEIAPTTDWQATVMPLNKANVAGTGSFAGKNAAQYGGSYNALVSAAFNDPSNPKAAGETSPPQVSGASPGVVPSFAFTGDTSAGAGAYAVTIGSQDSYTRYLEVAWLFSDVLHALEQNPRDTGTDVVAQLAAWELFANYQNLSPLVSAVNNSPGSYMFTNYLALTGLQTYRNTATVQQQSTPPVTLQKAVNAALAAAQEAVVNDLWGPGSSHYDPWSLVTGTPEYVVGHGRPVQEFLSPSIPDPPAPIPEPGAVFLLATGAAIAIRTSRAWRPIRLRSNPSAQPVPGQPGQFVQ